MLYKEAIAYAAENLKLIGQKSRNGFTITDLLIVPSSPQSLETFMSYYLSGYAPLLSIKPFINEYVEVWAIDRNYIMRGICFYENLE